MRLAALGGRHPFAGGERMTLSVVEEIGVLDLTTGDALGPVGDRSVTVGRPGSDWRPRESRRRTASAR